MSSSALTAIRPQAILCLCLGNICRSPLAEGIIQRELISRKLTSWSVDSCGTSGEHDGEGADDRSIAAAKRKGLDITKHISRKLTKEDWTKFDVILAMDSSNYRNATRMKPSNATAKLLMYLPKGDVPDPWYGSDRGFDDCYELLNKHVGYVFDMIVKEGGGAATTKGDENSDEE